jgi:hypothetical protein
MRRLRRDETQQWNSTTMNSAYRHDSLSHDIVQIWYRLKESIKDLALLSAYRQLMSADQLLREKRFRFERLARALQRICRDA